MSEGMYILVRFVSIFLDVIMVAMLARAVLSWFTFSEGANKIGSFLYTMTEPLILPVRALFSRFGWFEGVPLDIPFLVTALLLSLFSSMVGASL
jgi:uncharacterized protein YggT (Ycf19 family)